MKYTFKGGFHPPDGKKYSRNKKIELLPDPDMVAIHLHQHIGAPSKSIVKVGDLVEIGQPLSEPMGFVSIPVHSPISGKIKALAKLPDAAGIKSDAVVIENDHENKMYKNTGQKVTYDNLTPKELLEKISQSGVAGMGGARFPTHVKLSPPSDKPIEYLILNGVECEPYLTADDALMQEKPTEILEGMKIMMKIINCQKGIIGIEKNKPEAIKIMKEVCKKYPGIDIIELEVKYPQGGEKQLIKATTGKEVPSGGLPMDVGVVVSNVGTTNAVYEAIAYNKPFYERVVSVTGEGMNDPKNVLAKLGTSTKILIDFAGGVSEETIKIINGGPMMGMAMSDLTAPIHKGTSGILALGKANADVLPEQACISCGKCISVCPIKLLPCSIAAYSQNSMFENAKKIGIMDCMKCGTCAYVCPASRNLVHYIVKGQSEVAKMKK